MNTDSLSHWSIHLFIEHTIKASITIFDFATNSRYFSSLNVLNDNNKRRKAILLGVLHSVSIRLLHFEKCVYSTCYYSFI